MTDQTTASLLNMLVLEVMTAKGKITSLDDKLDNVASDISSIKDLLQQLVIKVSALEQQETSPNVAIDKSGTALYFSTTGTLTRPPHSTEKEDLALLKRHLSSTLASDNITIDVGGAYKYLNISADKLIADLAPACYRGNTKNWICLRPESRTAMINALTQQAKTHHIHLDRCERNWGARHILRRKLNNLNSNQKKQEERNTKKAGNSTGDREILKERRGQTDLRKK
ncbi:hypothetical protein [Absidia glauca]|uniref:Uncharacterized protein n=1 Tax=Absidia glauca TaxID=4829 RepID=A0A163J023_ABSGL|nr:hypothetical protein [Absidia glauca]